MKKIFSMLVSLVLSVLMCFSLVGCNITSINSKKDMEQVVAEVNVLGGDFKTSKIYKQDLISAYVSYGYYYAYYGYTNEQIFNLIIENLVGTEIMIQSIMLEYEEDASVVKNTSYSKYDVNRYLDEDQVEEAKYNAIKSINDLIDGYAEKEETFNDTYSGTVRAVPTNATNKEKDVDKDAYIQKGIYDVAIGEERHESYSKLINYLKNNSLLGEYTSDITTTEYYLDIYEGQLENQLLTGYSEKFVNEYRKQVNYSEVAAKYAEMFEAQKSNSSNVTSWEEALKNASADSPIVYTPYNGYGYVYNLLLGASDVQKNDIATLKKEYTDTKLFEQARKAVLQATTVKDLRSSWITSGYDFDGEKFTGDYTFTEAVDSLPFHGSVTKIADATDEENAKYRVDSLDEFDLDGFIAYMNEYLYKGQVGSKTDDNNVYYKAQVGDVVTDYDEKINELLFAFSTDTGSLNTYKGYVINPIKDVGQTEQWVITFANAGRELLDMGGNSYMVVASDYGYHIMFYSSECSVGEDYSTLDLYLDSIDATKGGFNSWEEYFNDIVNDWEKYEESDFYLYKLASMYIGADAKYTKHETEIVNTYRYDTQKVKIYTKAYENLIG